MINKIFMLALIFVYGTVFAQTPDAAVVINQTTLNGFLNAIGPLSGSDQYNVMGSKGEYTWTMKNARIELKPNQAQFITDASVKAGLFSYGAVAIGGVDVKYHPETNRISVKVQQAILEIYFKIFGKKIHIADIDAAKFYRPEFEFAGPQPIQPKVDVALPGGGTKTIYILPTAQNLRIEQEKIVVTSQLIFSDQPIQKGP